MGRPGYPGDTTDSDSGRNHGDPRWRLAHQLATYGAGDRCRLAARCLLYSLTGAVALTLDSTLLAFALVFFVALVFWWNRRRLQQEAVKKGPIYLLLCALFNFSEVHLFVCIIPFMCRSGQFYLLLLSPFFYDATKYLDSSFYPLLDGGGPG